MKRPPKDIGCGLIALLGSIAGVLFGFAASTAWYRYAMIVLFGVGALDCLRVGKRWSAFGWTLGGVGVIVGYQILGRWGILAGLVAAYVIATPLINKFEEKIL